MCKRGIRQKLHRRHPDQFASLITAPNCLSDIERKGDRLTHCQFKFRLGDRDFLPFLKVLRHDAQERGAGGSPALFGA